MSIDRELMPVLLSEINNLNLNFESEERMMLADCLSKLKQPELLVLIQQVSKLSTLIRMAALGS